MFSDFLQFLSSPTGTLLVAAVLGVLFVMWLFRQPTFARTDFSYRVPLIGKLSRYSRDYSETEHGKWLNSETRLCHDYARHLTGLSPDEFENHAEYLRKCYDNGRKPIPGLMIALLVFLVVLEGLGFSYLLSTWMALEGSEDTRQLLTFAIVTVLSAVLVWTMHAAGHQLYRTRLLRSCFQQFQAFGLHERNKRIVDRRFTTQIISLNQDQSDDDDQPAHVQCANRVATNPGDTGSYSWLIIALIFIVAIAVLSTVLRIETLHSEPVVMAGAESENQVLAREYAALSSFWILATIFVVTQFVGMGLGYKYGFAGRESDTAYRMTHGMPDYESYYRPIAKRMSIADSRLANLHAMMERRYPGSINWERDFYEFVKEERGRGVCDLHHPEEVLEAKARRSEKRAAMRQARHSANGSASGTATTDSDTSGPTKDDGREGEGALQ